MTREGRTNENQPCKAVNTLAGLLTNKVEPVEIGLSTARAKLGEKQTSKKLLRAQIGQSTVREKKRLQKDDVFSAKWYLPPQPASGICFRYNLPQYQHVNVMLM